MKKVGFIGLGDMGIYMSHNLMKAGYPVNGYDMNEARVQQFAANGGQACGSSAEVAKNSDIVFIMVLNGDQVKTVMYGEHGLMESIRPDTKIIITATIGDKPMAEVAQKALKQQVQVVDCAVTGGQSGAANGNLTLMVAAPQKALDECMPILKIIGEKIVVAGERPGMGQIVKNCNGVLSALCTIATCEALTLGVKAGVSPEPIIDVLSNGTGSSPIFKNYSAKIIERVFSGGGSQLKLLYKDTNIVMEMATRLNVPVYGTAVCNEVIHAAMAKYPGEDIWASAKLYEEVAGIEIRSTKNGKEMR